MRRHCYPGWMRRWSLLFACLCGACEFGEGDAKVPGEALGMFDVRAELTESDCGSGALGSSDIWEFEIKLSKDYDQLFWLNGREVISGTLASDGETFEFDTRVEVAVLEPGPGASGCTLNRQDRARGRLGYDEQAVSSFAGTLTFSYMPVGDSNCSPMIGVEGGFRTLPCQMSYRLDAARRLEK